MARFPARQRTCRDRAGRTGRPVSAEHLRGSTACSRVFSITTMCSPPPANTKTITGLPDRVAVARRTELDAVGTRAGAAHVAAAVVGAVGLRGGLRRRAAAAVSDWPYVGAELRRLLVEFGDLAPRRVAAACVFDCRRRQASCASRDRSERRPIPAAVGAGRGDGPSAAGAAAARDRGRARRAFDSTNVGPGALAVETAADRDDRRVAAAIPPAPRTSDGAGAGARAPRRRVRRSAARRALARSRAATNSSISGARRAGRAPPSARRGGRRRRASRAAAPRHLVDGQTEVAARPRRARRRARRRGARRADRVRAVRGVGSSSSWSQGVGCSEGVSRFPRRSASAARPREIRERTVPGGMPSTSAISA